LKRRPTLRHLRLAVQIACLAGFVWLFLQTEYRGLDRLPYPVGLLFRLDPLAAVADALAPGPFGWKLLWPALLLLLLTAVLGRFFCGWVCPLGTTLDGCGKALGRGRGGVRPGWRRVKYYLLLALSAAALFGVQLFGLFDPLSVFLRSLTVALYPAYNLAANGVFDFFYEHRIPVVSPLLDGAYPFFRDHLMAFHQPYFTLALFTFLVFVGLLLLEKVERRFWCRNLCPLGALLGLCAKRSLLRRSPEGLCGDCRACAAECRMDAVAPVGRRKEECILCLDCTGYCPEERVSFRWGGRPEPAAGVDLTRRGMVGALVGGALIAPVARIAPESSSLNSHLLRPPGAVAEEEFLRRCIRCGECMKVCIGGALHPAFFQAGGIGLWTPLLIPRIGYCEYNCTLCGQVCPTGAIKLLDLPEKQKTVIGLAVFDKNRCLPFAKAEECLVCEEHCPTGKKAIVFEEKDVEIAGEARRIKIPRVVKDLCVGCGICETKCPLDGASAVRVINEGESRRRRDGWV
jgi:MauM/NapG family ferredoxin protein